MSDVGLTAAVAVDGLTAGYGDGAVLNSVSLRVDTGSAVALLGVNGAGKTTLLRSIAGLVPISAGTVHLHGADVTSLGVRERVEHGLCYIGEGRSIFPALTVRENLLMFCRGRDLGSGIVRAAEVFPALAALLPRLAGTLSGGQQQMLALARAVCATTSVVLIDEASLGLAPVIVDAVYAAVELLLERGISLLLVEQYVARAVALAGTAYLLDGGRIAFAGPSAGLSGIDLAGTYLGGATR